MNGSFMAVAFGYPCPHFSCHGLISFFLTGLLSRDRICRPISPVPPPCRPVIAAPLAPALGRFTADRRGYLRFRFPVYLHPWRRFLFSVPTPPRTLLSQIVCAVPRQPVDGPHTLSRLSRQSGVHWQASRPARALSARGVSGNRYPGGTGIIRGKKKGRDR
jgi:hypothetical protein